MFLQTRHAYTKRMGSDKGGGSTMKAIIKELLKPLTDLQESWHTDTIMCFSESWERGFEIGSN